VLEKLREVTEMLAVATPTLGVGVLLVMGVLLQPVKTIHPARTAKTPQKVLIDFPPCLSCIDPHRLS
jgi:hypothetical protein